MTGTTVQSPLILAFLLIGFVRSSIMERAL